MDSPGIDRPPIRVIISGGIGSGKSTVAARLRELGGHVIEADAIGHEVLEPGGEAYVAVAERWPSVVVEGRIDRARLADIVFADGDELRILEGITHPAIAGELRRRVEQSTGPLVAVELPVGADLLGAGWIRVVVEAPEELRLARAIGRGMDEQDVRRRMAAQPTDAEWRDGAAFVIVNDGEESQLFEAVDQLWARLVPQPAAAGDAGDRFGGPGPEGPATVV